MSSSLIIVTVKNDEAILVWDEHYWQFSLQVYDHQGDKIKLGFTQPYHEDSGRPSGIASYFSHDAELDEPFEIEWETLREVVDLVVTVTFVDDHEFQVLLKLPESWSARTRSDMEHTL